MYSCLFNFLFLLISLPRPSNHLGRCPRNPNSTTCLSEYFLHHSTWPKDPPPFLLVYSSPAIMEVPPNSLLLSAAATITAPMHCILVIRKRELERSAVKGVMSRNRNNWWGDADKW
ncbi:conserved hypothetical protein, unlikely [Trypanosoma brucei gambiense DAL972]|nr:conserved hypothetical protein, unlikely [Trypanosoma brucei gambiense DAL972]RHW67347.1 hypothetical protein DPX39_000017700 [Trypanosoma brucei equiperdum]CBH13996.1 conserved hypothetical protein, unlikely [Trypanosoma brucei gambiense DAL972]|eukprot:XP_011776269.1 conserved hypothetical protein, unlikely [Trypanosoma brucei gambiense DAL972]